VQQQQHHHKMSHHRIKKATGWVQRLKQLQDFARPLNDNLFVDTCRSSSTSHHHQTPSSSQLHYRELVAGAPNNNDPYSGGFHVVEFASDGSFMVTGNSFDSICLWPIDQILSGEKKTNPIRLQGRNPKKVFYLAISRDNRRILSSDLHGAIVIHDSERYIQYSLHAII